MKKLIISYDIGSTGCKTCLYRVDKKFELVDSALSLYESIPLPNGGLEQNPDDWWNAMVVTTKAVTGKIDMDNCSIEGISFCAQMQGLVLIDKELNHLRPAMSYLDQRGEKQKKDSLGHGFKIEGINAIKMVKSLIINGAVSASVKDPVWKYKWVEENEPGVFSQVYKWLDIKDYLIARATGRCTMTGDSAFATFLTAKNKGNIKWSPNLLKMYKVQPCHMPEIINSTDIAGNLLNERAEELGLPSSIPVFGGGGDASMITIGAGATEVDDCYIYTGTSGWVSLTVKKEKIDISSRIASIIGAQKGYYSFFAEQETAGRCLQWIAEHLAKDEINLYLSDKSIVDDPESKYSSLYDFLIESIEQIEPGADSVIFTPWLHGNRAPFEDPYSRGIFFNIAIDTGKRTLIRAVVEGIIFHQKWLLESIKKSFPVSGPLRFVGGGALSPVIAQIMADILGYTIQTINDPQNCGAAGAALTAAIGLNFIEGFDQVKKYIPVDKKYVPRQEYRELYEKQFVVFKKLYKQNRLLFSELNKK